MTKLSKAQLRAFWTELLPDLQATLKSFDVALDSELGRTAQLILLGAATQHANTLHALTGWSRAWLHLRLTRLRAYGIWGPTARACHVRAELWEQEYGVLTFVLDAMAVNGQIFLTAPGTYAAAPPGRRRRAAFLPEYLPVAQIWIACAVEPGMFSTEYAVTIDLLHGQRADLFAGRDLVQLAPQQLPGHWPARAWLRATFAGREGGYVHVCLHQISSHGQFLLLPATRTCLSPQTGEPVPESGEFAEIQAP